MTCLNVRQKGNWLGFPTSGMPDTDMSRSTPATPPPDALASTSAGPAAKRLFLATRPMFLPASVLPVLLGTAWGQRGEAQFQFSAFALALAAVVLVHAAANIVNDVYDDLGGTDRINNGRFGPFTGGSRFIQNGIMTGRQMFFWGVALLGLAAVPGLVLAAVEGPGVLAFGAAGLALGVLYSVPPVQLSARGLGEIAVGLAFGVLPVMGAAWLQSGTLDPGAFLLSLPVALWVADILLVNEVPDIAADAATGKRTLAVRLGPAGTARLFFVLNVVAAAFIGIAAALGVLPLPAVAAVLLVSAAIPAARAIARPGPNRPALLRAIKLTLAIHALGTLWLTGWAWLG